MPKLELVVVGLCAIALDAPIDSSKKVDPKDFNTSKFDVYLMAEDSHESTIFIRSDGIDVDKLKCAEGIGEGCITTCLDDVRGDEIDVSICRNESSEGWVPWDLHNTTVKISQKKLQLPEFRKGHRNVADESWVGKKVREGCGIADTECERDISWLSEMARTGKSTGGLQEGYQPTPGDGVISGVIEKINGDLYSTWVSDRSWSWVGRKSNGDPCEPGSIDYEQAFAGRAVFNKIGASKIVLKKETAQTEIPLKGNAQALVANVPDSFPDPIGMTPGICVMEHYLHYYSLTEAMDVDKCYPVPATNPIYLPSTKEWVCVNVGYAGLNDPFCAPTGINRRKGGN